MNTRAIWKWSRQSWAIVTLKQRWTFMLRQRIARSNKLLKTCLNWIFSKRGPQLRGSDNKYPAVTTSWQQSSCFPWYHMIQYGIQGKPQKRLFDSIWYGMISWGYISPQWSPSTSKSRKKPVFMRVSGLSKPDKFTSLHQIYTNRCWKRCRD